MSVELIHSIEKKKDILVDRTKTNSQETLDFGNELLKTLSFF